MASSKEFIKTPEFRGNFVALAKPKKQERDDGSVSEKYCMMIALPKNDQASKEFVKQLMAMIQRCSKAGHGSEIPRERLKHYPIKDGKTMEDEQFHDKFIINCASNYKPSCVDKSGMELETEAELYSGAWYKCKLSCWAWNNPKGGKGVSINLESVLKTRDDKRLGGGSDAKDDFADDIDGKPSATDGDVDDLLS